ncbi:MAG: hypothetical protein JW810_09405 [Sedimentisphaerales bacterium]|nr:hypothetical protein [Sedimentisphaerales bacterium]
MLSTAGDSSAASTSAATEPAPAAGAAYKAEAGPFEIQTIESIEYRDTRRQKTLSLRLQYPKYPASPPTANVGGNTTSRSTGQLPLIIFSHGAGGSSNGALSLTRHWVSHGYITIQPTHEDSIALRRGRSERYTILDALRTVEQDPQAWVDRARDIGFLLDRLEQIEEHLPSPAARIDPGRIGMAGHSFGAMTTMYLAGATIELPGAPKAQTFGDGRIRTFLALSPAGPGRMGFTQTSAISISRPLMLMTGSRDGGGRSEFTPQWRLSSFESLPPNDKYAIWIEGAGHMTFAGDARRAAAGRLRPFARPDPRNLDQQEQFIRYIRIASTAFWDAYLKDDPLARGYLCSEALEQYSQQVVDLRVK